MSPTPVLTFPHFRRAVALALVLTALSAAQDKRLTVSGPHGAFSVPVIEREGKDYVSLIEVLIPLGDTTAKPDGKKWKLRFSGTDSEFKAGSDNPFAAASVVIDRPLTLKGYNVVIRPQ